jgi:DNA ligase-associated metallophosphoesterase
MTLQISGETLRLLPQRAFFWEEKRILGFSDLHLGKAESLQNFGIPLPSAVHDEDFKRISLLIQKWNPSEIVILGDFIHQKNSWTKELFDKLQNFLNSFRDIRWTLILGNHEKGSLAFLQQLPLKLIKNEWICEPFIFTHGHSEREPDLASNLFQIEGHIHPVLTLRDGPLKMRFPCFALTETHLLLPSFGVLTGGFEIPLLKNQRYFAVTENQIFEVDPEARRT